MILVDNSGGIKLKYHQKYMIKLTKYETIKSSALFRVFAYFQELYNDIEGVSLEFLIKVLYM